MCTEVLAAYSVLGSKPDGWKEDLSPLERFTFWLNGLFPGKPKVEDETKVEEAEVDVSDEQRLCEKRCDEAAVRMLILAQRRKKDLRKQSGGALRSVASQLNPLAVRRVPEDHRILNQIGQPALGARETMWMACYTDKTVRPGLRLLALESIVNAGLSGRFSGDSELRVEEAMRHALHTATDAFTAAQGGQVLHTTAYLALSKLLASETYQDVVRNFAELIFLHQDL